MKNFSLRKLKNKFTKPKKINPITQSYGEIEVNLVHLNDYIGNIKPVINSYLLNNDKTSNFFINDKDSPSILFQKIEYIFETESSNFVDGLCSMGNMIFEIRCDVQKTDAMEQLTQFVNLLMEALHTIHINSHQVMQGNHIVIYFGTTLLSLKEYIELIMTKDISLRDNIFISRIMNIISTSIVSSYFKETYIYENMDMKYAIDEKFNTTVCAVRSLQVPDNNEPVVMMIDYNLIAGTDVLGYRANEYSFINYVIKSSSAKEISVLTQFAKITGTVLNTSTVGNCKLSILSLSFKKITTLMIYNSIHNDKVITDILNSLPDDIYKKYNFRNKSTTTASYDDIDEIVE